MVEERVERDAMTLLACKRISARMKQLQDRPNQAVRVLAQLLFSLLSVVSLQLLPHILACCKDAIEQATPVIRADLMILLHAVVYRCFDATRKDILLKWYLQVAHDARLSVASPITAKSSE